MPIKISCGDCSAKLAVKDELAGRTVKCPKCQQAIKVPAPASDGDAPVSAGSKSAAWDKPAAKRPPEPAKPAKKPAKPRDEEDEEDDEPRRKPAKRGAMANDDDEDDRPKGKSKAPAKRRDDDDDDEDEDDGGEKSLKHWLSGTLLPAAVKKQVNNEITAKEDVVWLGQPCPKMMIVRNLWAIFVGVFFVSMFIFVGGFLLLKDMSGATKGILLGGLWLVAVVGISALVPILSRRKAHQTCYVITTRRAIVFAGGFFGSPSIESFKPNLLAHMRPMKSWVFKDGAGDLVFRSVTTITTTHHKHGGSSTSRSTAYYGFLAIRNMDKIEQKIRRTLLVDDDDDDDDD